MISNHPIFIGHSRISDCVICTPIDNNEQLFYKAFVKTVGYCFDVTPNINLQSIFQVYLVLSIKQKDFIKSLIIFGGWLYQSGGDV